jgi:hypothetical protein
VLQRGQGLQLWKLCGRRTRYLMVQVHKRRGDLHDADVFSQPAGSP